MTEGTKYHPLFEHLLFGGQGEVTMTFDEIEQVIERKLPPSARAREEWWSNSPKGHSQARAWMRAFYRTSRVNLAEEKVTFTLEGWPDGYVKPSFFQRKPLSETVGGFGEGTQAAYGSADDPSKRGELDHPLFGVWKGKVTLDPGIDLTKPAFEPDVRNG